MKVLFSKARLACAAMGIVALLFASGCAQAPPQASTPFVIPVFPPPPETPRFYWERTLHSSANVVPDDNDGPLRRMVTGESRSGEGMVKPYGVAVRNGRVFVSDTAARHVVLFDLNAKTYARIGEDDPGSLKMPFGMDIDNQGNLYVVDGVLKRVHVYDAQGKFVRMMGHDMKWSRPVGLAVDAARKRVYVVDIGGVDSPDHRVRVLDLETGNLLFDIGKRGIGPGELNLPRDATVGADGLLYVVDGGNFRIQVYDTDGKFIKTFGILGLQAGQFARPKEIAADPQGNVYVIDTAFGHFQIFDKEGVLLLVVGTRDGIDGPAKFTLPSGVAVDLDGRVYVVDQVFRKVEVFRPAELPATARYGQPAGLAQPTPAGGRQQQVNAPPSLR